MCDLSLVVPCFNEAESVPIFYRAAREMLDGLKAAGRIRSAEMLFVDDGSTDGTLDILRGLSGGDSSVRFVSFSRNFGKEAALYAGLEKSRGRYIATLDADMQDPPSLVPEMLDAVLGGGYECAAARRADRKGEPPVRSFFARRFYGVMRFLSDIEVVSGARDFRVMSRKYADAVLSLCERNRFSKGIFPWVGFRTKWFEFENVGRSAGKTKWSFRRLFLYSLDGILGFSVKPLALVSFLGVLALFAAVLMIAFVIARKILFGDPVAGWPSLVCIILLLFGLQFFTSGILGQYVARIYQEIKRRPIYIIQEEI